MKTGITGWTGSVNGSPRQSWVYLVGLVQPVFSSRRIPSELDALQTEVNALKRLQAETAGRRCLHPASDAFGKPSMRIDPSSRPSPRSRRNGRVTSSTATLIMRDEQPQNAGGFSTRFSWRDPSETLSSAQPC
jgi:hypothetical protein